MIWYNDLRGFITADNYYEVLPTSVMSLEEKLNAIVRLFVYFGVIMALVRADYRYLLFGLVAGLISVVIYTFETKQRAVAEKFLEDRQLDIVDNKVCSKSTVDNPFMNPSIIDITDNPTHPQACDLGNERVKGTVEDNFNARLFRDSGDLYDRMSSQRQFYTMPSTTIPNDQSSFAQWVYQPARTCKEDSIECKPAIFYHRKFDS